MSSFAPESRIGESIKTELGRDFTLPLIRFIYLTEFKPEEVQEGLITVIRFPLEVIGAGKGEIMVEKPVSELKEMILEQDQAYREFGIYTPAGEIDLPVTLGNSTRTIRPDTAPVTIAATLSEYQPELILTMQYGSDRFQALSADSDDNSMIFYSWRKPPDNRTSFVLYPPKPHILTQPKLRFQTRQS